MIIHLSPFLLSIYTLESDDGYHQVPGNFWLARKSWHYCWGTHVFWWTRPNFTHFSPPHVFWWTQKSHVFWWTQKSHVFWWSLPLLKPHFFLMDPKTSCLLMDPLFFSPSKTSCLLTDPKTSCLLMDPLVDPKGPSKDMSAQLFPFCVAKQLQKLSFSPNLLDILPFKLELRLVCHFKALKTLI